MSTFHHKISIVEILSEFNNMYFRHMHNIARFLRKADYNEIKSAAGKEPYGVIMEACKVSARKWVVLRQDDEKSPHVPVALFGVVSSPENEKVGIPWMVATDQFKEIRLFALKNSLSCIEAVKVGYDSLHNFVDARNLDAIEWLSMCGFTIHDAVEYGHEKLPFYEFDMNCGVTEPQKPRVNGA